jgi:hypothetical protein
MNHFFINGEERPSPIDAAGDVRNLVDHLHRSYVHESSVISSIRIDGQEIREGDRSALSDMKLADVDTVEVLVMHPREMAEDTLQTLILFTERLADLSRQAAEELNTPASDASFSRLLDGMRTFIESVQTTRRVLRIGVLGPVDLLEADLLSIMKDVLKAREGNQVEYMSQLLMDHLPINLHDWCVKGLPAMIRSRDS